MCIYIFEIRVPHSGYCSISDASNKMLSLPLT